MSDASKNTSRDAGEVQFVEEVLLRVKSITLESVGKSSARSRLDEHD